MIRPSALRGPAILAGVFLTSVAHAAEKGMPQLDFANPLTVAQVVWLAVIFLALYLALDRWALPQVGGVLKQRADHIEADLEAARSAKATADAAVAELRATLAKARADAQVAVNAAVDKAKAEGAAHTAIVNERLNAQLAEAEKRIAAARAAATGALREVAVTTTADVVARLSGHVPDTAAVNAAVSHALAARAA